MTNEPSPEQAAIRSLRGLLATGVLLEDRLQQAWHRDIGRSHTTTLVNVHRVISDINQWAEKVRTVLDNE